MERSLSAVIALLNMKTKAFHWTVGSSGDCPVCNKAELVPSMDLMPVLNIQWVMLGQGIQLHSRWESRYHQELVYMCLLVQQLPARLALLGCCDTK